MFIVKLHYEDDIQIEMFCLLNSKMITQKFYLLPENQNQSKNLSIGFVIGLLLLTDLYSS